MREPTTYSNETVPHVADGEKPACILTRLDHHGYPIADKVPPTDKELRRDIADGTRIIRFNDDSWKSLFADDDWMRIFQDSDDMSDLVDWKGFRAMLEKAAQTDPHLVIYLQHWDKQGRGTFRPNPTYHQLYQLALGVMKADPFFGPITTTYGDDFGFSYIVDENTDAVDASQNLLFNMKLTALDAHVMHLHELEDEPEVYEHEMTLALDKNLESFVQRFVAHFAEDDPVIRKMFRIFQNEIRECHWIGLLDLMRFILATADRHKCVCDQVARLKAVA